LGLIDARGRFYDPKFGVFLSADPIGPLSGSSMFGNRYAYVGYDPVNRTDPTGYGNELECVGGTGRCPPPGSDKDKPWDPMKAVRDGLQAVADFFSGDSKGAPSGPSVPAAAPAKASTPGGGGAASGVAAPAAPAAEPIPFTPGPPDNYSNPVVAKLAMGVGWATSAVAAGAETTLATAGQGVARAAAVAVVAMGQVATVGVIVLGSVFATGSESVTGDQSGTAETRDNPKHFTPDQQAVIDLAKKGQRTGVTSGEAEALIDLAKSAGIPTRNDMGTEHWVGGDHIHVGPVHHIPVRP
jgi:hypothetical protein